MCRMVHEICDDLEYCEINYVDDEGNHIQHCYYASGCCGWESCPPSVHPKHGENPCDCPLDNKFPTI